MRLLRTEIAIQASPRAIWDILGDIDRYGEWNAVLFDVSGRLAPGEFIDATIRFSNAETHRFRAKVIQVVEERELRWVSEVPGETISRAEHYFVLTPLADGSTHLEHCEAFDGPLADLIWSMMDSVGRRNYQEMNRALKARAEAAEAGDPHHQML
jgi:hypothetical protein